MECTFWPSNNQLHLTTIISRVTISRPSASSGHGKWSFDCHVCIAAGDQHSTLQQTNASAKALAVEDQSRPNASIIYHSLSTSPSIHPSEHQNLFKRREETHNCRQNNKDICNVLGCSSQQTQYTNLLQLQIVHISISYDLSAWSQSTIHLSVRQLSFVSLTLPASLYCSNCISLHRRRKMKTETTLYYKSPRVNRSHHIPLLVPTQLIIIIITRRQPPLRDPIIHRGVATTPM